MNISYRRKKQKRNLHQKLTDHEKELLKIARKLNKQKKKHRKEREIQKNKLKGASRLKRKIIARDRKVRQKLRKEGERIKVFSNKITFWLSHEKIQEIAIWTGYIKRIDLKILPLPFLLTLSCSFFGNGGSTLAMLAANMVTWFNIDITPQALSDRMSKIASVKFLKEILIQAMTQQIINGFKNSYADLFIKFKSVKIEDSTQFKLHENVKEMKGSGGSASTSAMKLNTVYNITNHTISHLDIVSGSTSDQGLSKNVLKLIKKAELWIRDLGYFDISAMIAIDKIKAFFISRLKKGVKIYFDKEGKNPIPIFDFLEENAKNGAQFDKDVYIGNGDDKLKVRIIGEKVPGHVQQKRIHNCKKNRIKRDKKKSMNKDYFTWLSYSVFITNVPREVFSSASIIMNIYKIRWQIELFFKRMKSIININVIKGKNENRVNCLIYAKLISLLMSQSIISYAAFTTCDEEELSEHKLLQWLKDNNRLGNAIIASNMKGLLIELMNSLYLLCKDKRKRKSTLRCIEDAFMSDLKERGVFENVA